MGPSNHSPPPSRSIYSSGPQLQRATFRPPFSKRWKENTRGTVEILPTGVGFAWRPVCTPFPEQPDAHTDTVTERAKRCPAVDRHPLTADRPAKSTTIIPAAMHVKIFGGGRLKTTRTVSNTFGLSGANCRCSPPHDEGLHIHNTELQLQGLLESLDRELRQTAVFLTSQRLFHRIPRPRRALFENSR
jgi:hypothetical protein